MNISLVLAWRNLWRHSRRTWLTVGAMIFSNILLVFLISLQFAMYDMMVSNGLQMFTGHLQVQHEKWLDEPRIENSFKPSSKFIESIEAMPGIIGVAPRAEGFVLASSKERSYGIQVMGVMPESEKAISSVPGFVRSGHYLTAGDKPEIVLGSILARNLKIGLGDELTIFGSARDGSSAAAILKVVGIFDSGLSDLDRMLTQIHLQQFNDIFFMQGDIHRLVVLSDDPDTILPLQQSIESLPILPKHSVVRDWNQLQPELQQAIQSDLASSWFMYIVLIVLVAFSVLNTQLMSVLERTKEFGIMMALGLSSWRLGKLVMLETILMASLGLIIGVSLGVCLVMYLQHAGFSYPGMDEMAAKFNLPSEIFPSVSLFTASLGPGLVFAASVLAAIYPSVRLHRLQVVQAMRAP